MSLLSAGSKILDIWEVLQSSPVKLLLSCSSEDGSFTTSRSLSLRMELDTSSHPYMSAQTLLLFGISLPLCCLTDSPSSFVSQHRLHSPWRCLSSLDEPEADPETSNWVIWEVVLANMAGGAGEWDREGRHPTQGVWAVGLCAVDNAAQSCWELLEGVELLNQDLHQLSSTPCATSRCELMQVLATGRWAGRQEVGGWRGQLPSMAALSGCGVHLWCLHAWSLSQISVSPLPPTFHPRLNAQWGSKALSPWFPSTWLSVWHGTYPQEVHEEWQNQAHVMISLKNSHKSANRNFNLGKNSLE